MSSSSGTSRQSTITPTKAGSMLLKFNSPAPETVAMAKTTNPVKRWKKVFNVIKIAKQFQKVRFIVDPKLHEDLDEYPIELEECTVEESSICFTDALTRESKSFYSKER